jgi:hydrogenase nickel incorporation protein HypA/HybF
MHELSIALSILDLAAEEADRRGATRVLGIHLKLGPYSGVAKEALLSAYDIAREGTPLAECALMVEEVSLRANCPTCRMVRDVVSVHKLRCSVCDAPTTDLVSGQEMEIVALEIQ